MFCLSMFSLAALKGSPAEQTIKIGAASKLHQPETLQPGNLVQCYQRLLLENKQPSEI